MLTRNISFVMLKRYREYDTLQLQLESSMSRIENEVKQYQEEILANETKHNLIELKRMQLQLLEKRANDEIKLYVSNKVSSIELKHKFIIYILISHYLVLVHN